ncbi:MAG: pseudouridylate synthase, partial [SAR324 cluster bacterium]|nr:pseudouridylate synthase [SAR324 cluster bacterium]
MECLPILYQDQQLVLINKPAGLLVHRSEMDRHESRNAMTMLRNQIGQWVYPVHRLDKPASGVLMFALDPATAKTMGNAFSEQQISKTYLAVVRGFTEASGCIDTPLKERIDKMTNKNPGRKKLAQTAVTNYQQLASVELPYPVGRYQTARYSLLKVNPLTGRNRQIRRHLKHIFHPIVGDVAHGDGRHNQFFRQHFHCHRLLLHAHQLGFNHPATQHPVLVNAPLDISFQQIINKKGDRFIF